MAILNELSFLVKNQRDAMGLTQERLAEIAGLSRATVNQLETGRISNLSLLKAEKLANVLGFGLGVTGARPVKADSDALQVAAQTASVSYSDMLPPETLRWSLTTGMVPPNYASHMRALLDEAPVGVLSAVAVQIEKEKGEPKRATWQRMRSLAAALGCSRGIWT